MNEISSIELVNSSNEENKELILDILYSRAKNGERDAKCIIRNYFSDSECLTCEKLKKELDNVKNISNHIIRRYWIITGIEIVPEFI